MRWAAVLAALGLALTAARSDPLAGRVAGPPAQCLDDMQATGGPTILDQSTILYRQSGRRLWVTHPDGPCPALAPLRTLIVIRYGAQTCAGDRFRVLDPGSTIPSGFCRFGPFVPYDKAPATGRSG